MNWLCRTIANIVTFFADLILWALGQETYAALQTSREAAEADRDSLAERLRDLEAPRASNKAARVAA